MKNLIILVLFPIISICGQTIRGKILDQTSDNPLPNANIFVENGSLGTVSDLNGQFELNADTGTVIIVTYLGYETKRITIDIPGIYLIIKLYPKILPSQSVLIQASLGKKGITPLVLERIGKEEIENTYSVQDIPQFLSNQPSVMSYSESGNGIGYNYLSIRGFDQRRISVSINGIPQNDPEDHNVYWLDFPDILGSTEMIQVQRGAGSMFGYPAIGGSVNIITSSTAGIPGIKLETYLGSFNTKKFSASVSSGLIAEKYSISAKLGQISSTGYRDQSWVKFNSYHLSATRYDKNLTTQVNFYGGPIEDGLAYTGVPKFLIKNENLRKANYSYWESDFSGDTLTFALSRRTDELENFSQPHYELLNEYRISDNVNLNSALFLVFGKGFFDYDGSWADTSYFRLTRQNGFNPNNNPGNTLIRAEVENTQYGWIPRLSLKHKNGELFIGGEFRIHRSNHWGNINYAENLPPGVTKDFRYYSYNGGKDILNTFIQENFRLTDNINILGEVQFAYNKYKLYNEDYLNTEFSVNHFFVNPRFGINYKISNNQNLFISFARVSREPRLKNYYDAAESSGGEVPLFEKNFDGSYNFSKPLVEPETMNDIEIGSSFTLGNVNAAINIFYMSFENEIVKNGKLDRFGQPITGNASRTLHQGIEFSAGFKILTGLEIWGNLSYSRNVIKEAHYFISENESIDLSENRISGFPDFLGNMGLVYSNTAVRLELTGKYVSEFYSDNYDENITSYLQRYPGFLSYSDNKNESYFISDFIGSYNIHLFNSLNPSKLYLRINNIFDKLYSTYAIGQEFFPAAERNFIAGIQIGL